MKHVYDGWGNLTTFEQDRDSAVTGGGNDYEVSYAYAKATGGRNTLRRTSVTLPGSTTFNYAYPDPSNMTDPSYFTIDVDDPGTWVDANGNPVSGMGMDLWNFKQGRECCQLIDGGAWSSEPYELFGRCFWLPIPGNLAKCIRCCNSRTGGGTGCPGGGEILWNAASTGDSSNSTSHSGGR